MNMGIRVTAERRQDDAKAQAEATQPVESGAERMHTWWELSYSSYLVIPRTIIQSMPDDWQGEFCTLLDRAHLILKAMNVEWPPKDHSIAVQLRHEPTGHYVKDDLADYQRGRRRLWQNENSTSSSQTQ